MEVGRAAFGSHGYEATAIDDVAHQAGVTKPIVYEHFGSKEGLYAAIVEREMDRLMARVSESISAGSPRGRFEGAVVAFLSYARDEPAGFAVLTRDSPIGAARRGLTRVIDELADRVRDVFRTELKRAGYDPRASPIYAHALVGMVTQVGQWWVSSGRRFSVDHVAQHVSALGWMGLRHLPAAPVTEARKRRRG